MANNWLTVDLGVNGLIVDLPLPDVCAESPTEKACQPLPTLTPLAGAGKVAVGGVFSSDDESYGLVLNGQLFYGGSAELTQIGWGISAAYRASLHRRFVLTWDLGFLSTITKGRTIDFDETAYGLASNIVGEYRFTSRISAYAGYGVFNPFGTTDVEHIFQGGARFTFWGSTVDEPKTTITSTVPDDNDREKSEAVRAALGKAEQSVALLQQYLDPKQLDVYLKTQVEKNPNKPPALAELEAIKACVDWMSLKDRMWEQVGANSYNTLSADLEGSINYVLASGSPEQKKQAYVLLDAGRRLIPNAAAHLAERMADKGSKGLVQRLQGLGREIKASIGSLPPRVGPDRAAPVQDQLIHYGKATTVFTDICESLGHLLVLAFGDGEKSLSLTVAGQLVECMYEGEHPQTGESARSASCSDRFRTELGTVFDPTSTVNALTDQLQKKLLAKEGHL